jgi:phospholipase C
VNSAGGGCEATAGYTSDFKLRLTLTNPTAKAVKFTVKVNHYGTGTSSYTVAAGKSVHHDFATCDGWYDLSTTVDTDPMFLRRYSGHVENGRPSITG